MIIEKLLYEAQQKKKNYLGNQTIEFHKAQEEQLLDMFFNGIEKIELMSPELLLGNIFDEIGFNAIKDELFKHLVITRFCFPVSKLKTADYLYKYKGVIIDVERIYRYLDKLHSRQKELVQQISYAHTCAVLNTTISVVFCACKIYKELERQLKEYKSNWSLEQAIAIANTIYRLTIIKPYSKELESRLILKNPEQEKLLKMFELI